MVSILTLTKGKFTIVDDGDFEWLSQWKWTFCNTGYAYRIGPRAEGRKKIYLHRLVAGVEKGDEVDHIDRNKLNNTRGNLRKCSRRENSCNNIRRSKKSSKYKGVFLKKRDNKWCAQIKVGGNSKHIGIFDRQEDAALAYNAMALVVHGEFAYLNEVAA